jgi:hypothetical protein
MVTCSQCGKPAVVNFGGNPLCVDCNLKLQQALAIRDRALKEQINYLLGSAEDTVGLPRGTFSRIQSAVPVSYYGDIKYEISFDNSNIGVVNTGTINALNLSLGQLGSQGASGLAGALKVFVESAISSSQIDQTTKQEAADIAKFVADQVANEEPRRYATVIRNSLLSLKEKISAAAPVLTAFNNLWGLVDKILS